MTDTDTNWHRTLGLRGTCLLRGVEGGITEYFPAHVQLIWEREEVSCRHTSLPGLYDGGTHFPTWHHHSLCWRSPHGHLLLYLPPHSLHSLQAQLELLRSENVYCSHIQATFRLSLKLEVWIWPCISNSQNTWAQDQKEKEATWWHHLPSPWVPLATDKAAGGRWACNVTSLCAHHHTGLFCRAAIP